MGIRVCIQCKQPFQYEHEHEILCEKCCHLEPHEICNSWLHLGEGSMECFIARADHPMPHFWKGEIDGKEVRVEWR